MFTSGISSGSRSSRWLLAAPVRATGVEEQQAEQLTSSTPQAAAPPPGATSSTASSRPPERIQRTLADLDALLGIEPDAPPASASTPSASPAAATSSDSTAGSPNAPLPRGDDKIEEHLKRIADKARKLADEQQNAQGGQAEQQQLRQEFETMLQSISASPATLDKEDIKRLKEGAFGPQTFFITETQTLTQADRTGLLVRGNLRDERAKVYQHICNKVWRVCPQGVALFLGCGARFHARERRRACAQHHTTFTRCLSWPLQVTELFGNKYTVLMVEDEDATLDAAAGGAAGGLGPQGLGSSVTPRQSDAATRAQQLNTPRIAFQIIPAAQAIPPQVCCRRRRPTSPPLPHSP